MPVTTICAIVGIAFLTYGFITQFLRANHLQKQLKGGDALR